jgi:hypothetical protein
MGKKYTTDIISVGDHNLDASMMASLNTVVSNYSNYATTSQLFSGNYNDLTNKPTIPTNNNQLTNGAGYTSNAGTVTSIATGTGLDGTFTTSGTITLDLSELTDMTGAIDASVDEIIMLDNGAERRKRFSEIFGSNAYNSTTIPTNNNQLTNGAGYTTNVGDITGVTAGGGITGGGTSGTVTLSHTNTSSQSSVNNSSGTVIQDITLDTYGHITGLASYNLDGRYYTETESDARFLNVAGDTMTGSLRAQADLNYFGLNNLNNEAEVIINTANAGSPQIGFTENGDASWAIGVDDGDNSFKIHGGANSTIPTINNLATPIFELTTSGLGFFGTQRIFAENYHPNADKWTAARTITLAGDLSGSVSIDGTSNVTLTATIADDSHDLTWNNIDGETANAVNTWGGLRHQTNGGYIDFGPANSNHAHIYTDRPNFYFNKELLVNNQQVFHVGYHPNADRWTVARTLLLSGDASGSVLWDGSDNATLSVSVNNDSHYHSQVYIPDTRGASRAPSYYPDRYTSFDFQNRSDTGAGGDSWHVLQTVAPWSSYNSTHRQQQIAFTGTGGLKFRYATSDSAWASWQTLWTSGNDGSDSGLDADKLDGQHGSYYYPASNPNGYTSNTGDITAVTVGNGLSGGGTSGSVNLAPNYSASSSNLIHSAPVTTSTGAKTYTPYILVAESNPGVGSGAVNKIKLENINLDRFGNTLSVGKTIRLSRNTLSTSNSTSPIYVDNTSTGNGTSYNYDSDVSSYFGSRHMAFRYNGTVRGSISQSGTTTVAFNTSNSDERLKKNIEIWDENILEKFEEIEPKKFNYLEDEDGQEKTKGYIAQEMVDSFPEAYPTDFSEENYYNYNPSGMVVYLTKAIKELIEKNKQLENRIQTLENN